MNVFLMIITIVVSMIVVRIGAVAFELTGLEWGVAKFQAMSCFSGTGFTTREAELILSHPQRRRIATYLMILGNAGLVTLIATFANSLSPDALFLTIHIPFIPDFLPVILMPWINLGIIVLSLFLIYRYAVNSDLTRRLLNAIQTKLVEQGILKTVPFEELLLTAGDYGIIRIDTGQAAGLQGKNIADSGLRSEEITVIAIERGDTVLPQPSVDTEIIPGDVFICFGKLQDIRTKLQNIECSDC